MKKNKSIYIFIGPKGSGKTFLCRLVERNLGVKFLDTEYIFKTIQSDGITTEENIIKAYNQIENEIDKYLSTNFKITFDTTGIADEFWCLVNRLKKKYTLNYIAVYAPEHICLERVRHRNNAEHISIDEAAVRQVNLLCGSLEFDAVLRVFTANPDNDEFLHEFESLLLNTI